MADNNQKKSSRGGCQFVVTGFGPFQGVESNPTTVIAEQLVDYLSTLSTTSSSSSSTCWKDLAHHTTTHVLEVSVDAVTRFLNDQQQQQQQQQQSSGHVVHDTVLLHLGVHYRGTGFQLETRAYNDATFRIPDQRGYQPTQEKIVTHLARGTALQSQLPLQSLCRQLQDTFQETTTDGGVQVTTTNNNHNNTDTATNKKGVHIFTSTDPGRFVCNYTYCYSLEKFGSSHSPMKPPTTSPPQETTCSETATTQPPVTTSPNHNNHNNNNHNNTNARVWSQFLHVPPVNVISMDIQLKFVAELMKAIQQYILQEVRQSSTTRRRDQHNGGPAVHHRHPTTTTTSTQKELHIAPMLHVSTFEFRNFMRILTRDAILWTEMVVDETVAFNSHSAYELAPHLHKNDIENPIVCQIGGIDANYTATAVQLVHEYGYDEINLNMDCPSDRVSGRNFGAVLMKQLEQAAQILQCMQDNASTYNLPVSVKCRIGIDEFDSLEFLEALIAQLSKVCQRFVLHARRCILKGLSPKENRIVPPLNYPRVYEISRRFPDCEFWINGGIPGLKVAKDILYGIPTTESTTTTEQAQHHHHQHQVPCAICNNPNGSCTTPPVPVPPNLKGCMLGRAAMDHPAQFADVDRYFYGRKENPCQTRRQVLDQYMTFLEQTYPRRCCDSDERVTSRLCPSRTFVHERPYCPVCREFFAEPKDIVVQDENEDDNRTAGTESVVGSGNCVQTYINTKSKKKNPRQKKPGVKIYQGTVDRALKPVFNIFFGLPKSKVFRRALDANCRDLNMRNCGPAFLLRKALQVMPPEVLDQQFTPTEMLKESDIPVHVSPSICPSSCS